MTTGLEDIGGITWAGFRNSANMNEDDFILLFTELDPDKTWWAEGVEEL